MAYVGGGFGRAGLHSVLEPAAWGVPVAFGPSWRNSRDAELLLQAGAAEALARGAGTRGRRGTGGSWWERWIGDESRRMVQGSRARAIVVGAGWARRDRSAEMLAELISSRPPRR